jgi:hypothetical protein
MKKLLLENITDSNTLDWEVSECSDKNSLFENPTEGLTIKLITDAELDFTYALVKLDDEIECGFTENEAELLSDLVDYLTEVMDDIEADIEDD